MSNYDAHFLSQKIKYKPKYNILVSDKFGPPKKGCKMSLQSHSDQAINTFKSC